MIDRIIKAIRMCNKTDIEIKGETNLRKDLNFDSLSTFMLIFELESEFDIDIEPSDFSKIKTVSDIAEKLKEAGKC